MGWKLKINFSDGSSELVDDIFDTKDEAEEEYDSWLENWSAGAETLELAGESYCDCDIEDCDIYEE